MKKIMAVVLVSTMAVFAASLSFANNIASVQDEAEEMMEQTQELIEQAEEDTDTTQEIFEESNNSDEEAAQ